jgi:hypothetical protein
MSLEGIASAQRIADAAHCCRLYVGIMMDNKGLELLAFASLVASMFVMCFLSRICGLIVVPAGPAATPGDASANVE